MAKQDFNTIDTYLVVFPFTLTDPYEDDSYIEHYLDYIIVSKEDLQDKIKELIKSGKTKFKVLKNIDFNYSIDLKMNKED